MAGKFQLFRGGTLSKRTERTPKGNHRAANEDEKHDDVSYSGNIAPSTAEHSSDKGRRREESIPHMQTSSSDHPSFPTDSNWAFWKSLRRKITPAKMTRNQPPMVVEVCVSRAPRKMYRRKPEKKSPASMINSNSAHIIAPHASGSSLTSLHGDTTDRGSPSQSMSIAGDAVQTGANGTTDD